jgi:hypothetical protein
MVFSSVKYEGPRAPPPLPALVVVDMMVENELTALLMDIWWNEVKGMKG